MLSREIATVLTEQHFLIEIFPFSFGEIIKSKNAFPVNLHLPEEKGKVINYLSYYLKFGGPEVVVNLDMLIDSLLKDVVKQLRIRFSHKISDLFPLFNRHFCPRIFFYSLREYPRF